MPSIQINDAGTIKPMKSAYVNDAGTVKPVKEVWVNDNGTVKRVYSSAPAVTFNPAPGNYELASDAVNTTTWSIVASQAVVWTYTKTGIGMVTPATGGSGTTLTLSMPKNASGSMNVTATLNGTQVGTWFVTWSNF